MHENLQLNIYQTHVTQGFSPKNEVGERLQEECLHEQHLFWYCCMYKNTISSQPTTPLVLSL